jgi:hypothetical protein
MEAWAFKSKGKMEKIKTGTFGRIRVGVVRKYSV